MERKARFIITTQKTRMSDTEFETIQAILDNAMMNKKENDDTILEDELENFFSGIDGEDDISDFITEGSVIRKPGGSIILKYNESEITGMQGAVTHIMFNEKKPDFVVVMRDGSVNSSLSFEEGKRHTSKYNTPYMPFNLCVNTLRVTNKFVDCGEIEIEYIIEIRGLSTEWTVLKIKVDFFD